MKKLFIALLLLASLPALAYEYKDLVKFEGSAFSFRRALKDAISRDFDVDCGSGAYRIKLYFPEINYNFRVKIVCKSPSRKVKAIALMRLVNLQDMRDVRVRSIKVDIKE